MYWSQSESEFEYFSIGVIADFTSNVRGVVPADTQIDFQDLSTNNPDEWDWDFGDGTHSSLQNPSYTYTALNGSFDVTLTAFKDGDQSDSCSSEDYIGLSNMNWETLVEDWDWRIIYQLTDFSNSLYASTSVIPSNGDPHIRRSDNDGSTWYPVLDATVYSLVVKEDTLYAPSSDTSDGGVMHMSTDGTNWNRSILTFNSL